jgi:hypothetical protein
VDIIRHIQTIAWWKDMHFTWSNFKKKCKHWSTTSSKQMSQMSIKSHRGRRGARLRDFKYSSLCIMFSARTLLYSHLQETPPSVTMVSGFRYFQILSWTSTCNRQHHVIHIYLLNMALVLKVWRNWFHLVKKCTHPCPNWSMTVCPKGRHINWQQILWPCTNSVLMKMHKPPMTDPAM